MARPREFDTDDAIERAMGMFWTHGYAATSLADLTDAMGISKSSLYETYGNKHALFLAALRRYADSHLAEAVAILEGDRPGREAIAAVFDRLLGRALSGEPRAGCFLANCASELAPHDPEIARYVADALARMEDAFACAVARGQAAGDIARRHDARALARFLVTSANGLQVMSKAGRDRAALEEVKRIVLAALE